LLDCFLRGKERRAAPGVGQPASEWGTLESAASILTSEVACRVLLMKRYTLPFRSFWRLSCFAAVVSILLLLNACGETAPVQTQPKIYLPAQPPLSGLPAAALQGALQGLMPLDEPLHLTIGLTMNRQALAEAAQRIYDPASAEYGHYLSAQEVAQQFGASPQAIQKVTGWLTGNGFQVLSTSSLGTSISVQGTVLQIAQAFHTVMQLRSLNGRTFFGPDQAPVLPKDIAPLVSSIIGLDNFAQIIHAASPFATTQRQLARSANHPLTGDCALYDASGLTRDDLAHAYAIDQLHSKGFKGQGMKIGVIELQEPYDRNDITNYMSCNGVNLHLRNVQVDGPLAAGSGEGEAALDLEMIAGLAPEAEIYDYQAPTLDTVGLIDTLNRAAADDVVRVLSISYGGGELGLNPAFMSQFDDTLELMAVEGISVFASSGDCGAFVDGQFGVLDVNFPASAPWAIAVGGTNLQGSRETAWSDPNPDRSQCQNQWGTGGGVSQNTSFSLPIWQTGSGVKNTHSNGKRQVPDVAAAATNIAVYYQGAWATFGGTSASAPIWAAGTLLVDQVLQKQGKPIFGGVPTVYQVANHPGKFHPFRDVTQGTNLFYQATSGWDYTTGWGVPRFIEVARALGASV
jgi:kumamolisin